MKGKSVISITRFSDCISVNYTLKWFYTRLSSIRLLLRHFSAKNLFLAKSVTRYTIPNWPLPICFTNKRLSKVRWSKWASRGTLECWLGSRACKEESVFDVMVGCLYEDNIISDDKPKFWTEIFEFYLSCSSSYTSLLNETLYFIRPLSRSRGAVWVGDVNLDGARLVMPLLLEEVLSPSLHSLIVDGWLSTRLFWLMGELQLIYFKASRLYTASIFSSTFIEGYILFN